MRRGRRAPRTPNSECGIRKGQAVIEYALLIGVLIGAILGMQVFAKRSVQAMVKMSADTISPYTKNGRPDGARAQMAGMRFEIGESRSKGPTEQGRVLVRASATRTRADQQLVYNETTDGGRRKDILQDLTRNTGAVIGRGAGVSSYSEVLTDPSR